MSCVIVRICIYDKKNNPEKAGNSIVWYQSSYKLWKHSAVGEQVSVRRHSIESCCTEVTLTLISSVVIIDTDLKRYYVCTKNNVML